MVLQVMEHCGSEQVNTGGRYIYFSALKYAYMKIHINFYLFFKLY